MNLDSSHLLRSRGLHASARPRAAGACPRDRAEQRADWTQWELGTVSGRAVQGALPLLVAEGPLRRVRPFGPRAGVRRLEVAGRTCGATSGLGLDTPRRSAAAAGLRVPELELVPWGARCDRAAQLLPVPRQSGGACAPWSPARRSNPQPQEGSHD